MQPAPDPNQMFDPQAALPTTPLVSQQQGAAGGRGIVPVQSTLPPDPYQPPPLPMKPVQANPAEEPQETVESQETTEVETIYTTEVNAPPTSRQRMRRTSKTIRFIFVVIEILLALRFFLKFIGANPSSPFGIFLFGLTDPLAAPFESLLANPTMGTEEIEFTTLLALIIYPIFGWIVVRSIQLMFYREKAGQQVVHQKRRTDREGF